MKLYPFKKCALPLLLAVVAIISLSSCQTASPDSESDTGLSGASVVEHSSGELSAPNAQSDASSAGGGQSSQAAAQDTKEIFLAISDRITDAIARNSDTVGWIMIPNTTIDDAVLQYKDNDYYLRLNEDKKYDIFGCYFMDYESVPQTTRFELSRNNIIYGHSDLRDNKDGLRFSQLYKYTDPEFVSSNPYIYYSTRDDGMVWQIFAVFYTRIDFEYHLGRPDSTTFLNIISEAKLRSEYIIDLPVGASDKILTLSTCTVNYNPSDRDNYRLVVMAKLLPSGAQLEPTMEVDLNPDPKRS